MSPRSLVRVACSLLGLVAASLLMAAGFGGCMNRPLSMEGRMDGNLRGDLNGALKLEGPVQIQMQVQGPTIRYEGTYISDELIDEVDIGDTTDDWVLAVFGEPTARADLRDGTTIWRWTYRPLVQEASVIEIFSGDEKDPKLATRTVFIQFRETLAIRKWKG